MKQASHSVVRRRLKTRLSPLPGPSPYLDELQRRSLSPTLRKAERTKRKKPQKTVPPTGLKTMPVREFSPESEVLMASFRREKLTTDYSECTEKLKYLRQAYSNVMRENLSLLSSFSRPSNGWKDVSSSYQHASLSTELHDLSDEQEQLYSLLSSSHHSLSLLLNKHRLLAHNLVQVQRDLGLLRYQQELKQASTAVKATLLDEVVRHRTDDYTQLLDVLDALRSETTAIEEEVAGSHCENVEMEGTVRKLLTTSPELAAISDLYSELAVVSAKVQLSEQHCRVLEDTIQNQGK